MSNKWRKRGWTTQQNDVGYYTLFFDYNGTKIANFSLNIKLMNELEQLGIILIPTYYNNWGANYSFKLAAANSNKLWTCMLSFKTVKDAQKFYETRVLPILVMNKLNEDISNG